MLEQDMPKLPEPVAFLAADGKTCVTEIDMWFQCFWTHLVTVEQAKNYAREHAAALRAENDNLLDLLRRYVESDSHADALKDEVTLQSSSLHREARAALAAQGTKA